MRIQRIVLIEGFARTFEHAGSFQQGVSSVSWRTNCRRVIGTRDTRGAGYSTVIFHWGFLLTRLHAFRCLENWKRFILRYFCAMNHICSDLGRGGCCEILHDVGIVTLPTDICDGKWWTGRLLLVCTVMMIYASTTVHGRAVVFYGLFSLRTCDSTKKRFILYLPHVGIVWRIRNIF